MGVSQNYGHHFGGPNNKDYRIWGSILGSPYFAKLPSKASNENSKWKPLNPSSNCARTWVGGGL